ncbi:type II secretion system protein GspM [Pseudomonas syringae]|nr:type II secretion system protein GspM [Pseudomonas syringae]
MNALFVRFSHGYAALPASRRYLLLGGWVVVLTLILVLIGRPLIDYGKDLRQWQRLAAQAQVLKPAGEFDNARWQALAGAYGVTLTGVEPRGDVWQLQGEVARADSLAHLMRSIEEQGARPLRWSLERRGAGLVFNLDVSRHGGQP